MTKMSDEASSRAADLHYAYQHGQDAAKGDATAEPEFRQKFAGDTEAQAEYQRGLVEQKTRQLGLAAIGSEAADAVLANSNIKMFMKLN